MGRGYSLGFYYVAKNSFCVPHYQVKVGDSWRDYSIDSISIEEGAMLWSPSEFNEFIYVEGRRFWKKDFEYDLDPIYPEHELYPQVLAKFQNNKVKKTFSFAKGSRLPKIGSNILIHKTDFYVNKIRIGGTDDKPKFKRKKIFFSHYPRIAAEVVNIEKTDEGYDFTVRTEKSNAQKAAIFRMLLNTYASRPDQYTEDGGYLNGIQDAKPLLHAKPIEKKLDLESGLKGLDALRDKFMKNKKS